MATHSSILAWETPWTEEPGRLQSMGSQELDMTKHTQYSTVTGLGTAFSVTDKIISTVYMYHRILIHSSANDEWASRASRLLPCPGYYKECCDEHWPLKRIHLIQF